MQSICIVVEEGWVWGQTLHGPLLPGVTCRLPPLRSPDVHVIPVCHHHPSPLSSPQVLFPGVIFDVPTSELREEGWRDLHAQAYADPIDSNVLQTAATFEFVLLGARRRGADRLQVKWKGWCGMAVPLPPLWIQSCVHVTSPRTVMCVPRSVTHLTPFPLSSFPVQVCAMGRSSEAFRVAEVMPGQVVSGVVGEWCKGC